MTIHRHWRLPKDANSVSLFLQIWQHRMPTLNQRLGSFPIESRAEIFPQCRQDCPLPPLINRGGFQALREKKTRSKVSHKISLFPVSATFSLSPPAVANSKPRCHQLHQRKPTQPLIGHQAAPGDLSLFSFRHISLLCKPFSSASNSLLRPPFPHPTPPEPPVETPHHIRDPHARQLPPSPPEMFSKKIQKTIFKKS